MRQYTTFAWSGRQCINMSEKSYELLPVLVHVLDTSKEVIILTTQNMIP